MLPKHVLYYGSEAALAKPISLTAGQLKMLFVPHQAFLRYVRLGDHEIIRGIYAAVRDRNWNTVPPRIWNLKIESGENTFHITATKEGNGYELELTPRTASMKRAFQKLNLRINDNLQAERTDMLLPNGDRIVTSYSNQKRAPVPSSTFEFTPPPGTDIATPLGR